MQEDAMPATIRRVAPRTSTRSPPGKRAGPGKTPLGCVTG
jgi:hypothetical protein